jgi:DNA invertase Pin-like site-specific DNA recombinase
MLIGYARISTSDGRQSLDLQVDALVAAGVAPESIYSDEASGKRADRPGLQACLKALRPADTLVVWKLDRLGRSLTDLLGIVRDLEQRGVGFRVITGQGAEIDTTTANGRLIFSIFAAIAEFERELIRERTLAGLAAARARGKLGGRKFGLTKSQVRRAQAAMSHRDTDVSELARELGVTRGTIYRYVGPGGELRAHGARVLGIPLDAGAGAGGGRDALGE